MPLPSVHPVTKTSRELRRSIGRLTAFKISNREEELVKDGTVKAIIEDLQAAMDKIPENLRT